MNYRYSSIHSFPTILNNNISMLLTFVESHETFMSWSGARLRRLIYLYFLASYFFVVIGFRHRTTNVFISSLQTKLVFYQSVVWRVEGKGYTLLGKTQTNMWRCDRLCSNCRE